MPETRGLCLSEEQTVSSVGALDTFFFSPFFSVNKYVRIWVLTFALYGFLKIQKKPRIGRNRILDMKTHPQKLTRRCEVTAILVLYGLPRLNPLLFLHGMLHFSKQCENVNANRIYIISIWRLIVYGYCKQFILHIQKKILYDPYLWAAASNTSCFP